MTSSRRALGVTLAIVALVATVLGVIYAATDSNPSGASDAALNYHGSLRTAQMEITIDTGQRYDVNGTIDMNFVTNRIRATVNIPLFFSTATISAIMANSQLYLTTPSIQSTAAKPWLSIPHGTNDLFPIQSTLEDFRQNLFCLQAIGPVKVTTTGPYTTYSTVGAVPKDTCMVPSLISSIPRVAVSVTLARKGQVAAATVVGGSGSSRIRVQLVVLSYNSPVVIIPPLKSQVQPLPANIAQQILSGKTPITKLLTPAGVNSIV